MSPFWAYLDGQERSGQTWPLGVEAVFAGLPSIPSLRVWGHSWTGGQDVPRGETGFPERLAGILGVSGSNFGNFGIFGSALMSDHDGWGYYLKNTTKAHSMNKWPWDPYHGIDAFFWGVNDFGTRHVSGLLGAAWPTQRDMWRDVWRESWRSVIQRSIAGGVYPAERRVPANVNDPLTGYHPTITFGGPGGGGWFWRPLETTGTGVWQTAVSGATVTITVPANYDTGHIAVRHLVPGSYFPGAQTIYGLDGTGPWPNGDAVPVNSRPAMVLGSAASEVFLAPTTITTATAGVTSVVRNPRILRDRRIYNALGPGTTLVDRIAAPITPGTARTVTITVGTLPAQGWYAFDSWEIESKQVSRPPVVVANVPDPANWATIYFIGINSWPGMEATSDLVSQDIANVCAEWDDPGICVADARAALVGHELDYAVLYPAGSTPLSTGGAGGVSLEGDGTHPFAIGSRLLAGCFRDGLVKAALPAERYALAYSPERDMVRA